MYELTIDFLWDSPLSLSTSACKFFVTVSSCCFRSMRLRVLRASLLFLAKSSISPCSSNPAASCLSLDTLIALLPISSAVSAAECPSLGPAASPNCSTFSLCISSVSHTSSFQSRSARDTFSISSISRYSSSPRSSEYTLAGIVLNSPSTAAEKRLPPASNRNGFESSSVTTLFTAMGDMIPFFLKSSIRISKSL